MQNIRDTLASVRGINLLVKNKIATIATIIIIDGINIFNNVIRKILIVFEALSTASFIKVVPSTAEPLESFEIVAIKPKETGKNIAR